MAEFKPDFIDFEGASLPFSTEAEQSVLGAILVDPASINLVADTLRPEYFYIPQHQAIYTTLQGMVELNTSIDFVTLLDRLKAMGVYDQAGGKSYLTQLAQMVPSSANIGTYADIVREKYYVRSLITASRDIIKDAGEATADAAVLLDSAEQRIFEIRSGKETTGLKHIRDILQQETYDRLTKISNPETRADFIGIPTGIREYDRMTTGLNKSDLIIVGARPGMGKTSFALQIATHVALREKKTVCFFSLEMTRDQLAQRVLSNQASVKVEKMRSGDLSTEEWKRIADAGADLSKGQLYFDETSNITVAQMKAKLRRMKNVDLVVVDYLGLMKGTGKSENRTNEVAEITRGLKLMAKDLKIPVIVCAQLNRGTEGKGQKESSHKPALSDLRESGSIEQDADIVLFIYRKKYYDTSGEESTVDEHDMELIVAKNRHGETGTIKLYWDGQYTRFTSVARNAE